MCQTPTQMQEAYIVYTIDEVKAITNFSREKYQAIAIAVQRTYAFNDRSQASEECRSWLWLSL